MAHLEQTFNQMEEDNILEIKYQILKLHLDPNETFQKEFDSIKFNKTDDVPTTYHNEGLNKGLSKEVEQYINNFIANYKFKINMIWAQRYEQSFHPAHVHLNCAASFIWYLDVEEGCSKLRLYNPGWPYVATHQFEIQPKTGLFILMPSFLPHEVLYNSNKKRNTIAGNLKWLK
jgi:hypothetical protein